MVPQILLRVFISLLTTIPKMLQCKTRLRPCQSKCAHPIRKIINILSFYRLVVKIAPHPALKRLLSRQDKLFCRKKPSIRGRAVREVLNWDRIDNFSNIIQNYSKATLPLIHPRFIIIIIIIIIIITNNKITIIISLVNKTNEWKTLNITKIVLETPIISNHHLWSLHRNNKLSRIVWFYHLLSLKAPSKRKKIITFKLPRSKIQRLQLNQFHKFNRHV